MAKKEVKTTDNGLDLLEDITSSILPSEHLAKLVNKKNIISVEEEEEEGEEEEEEDNTEDDVIADDVKNTKAPISSNNNKKGDNTIVDDDEEDDVNFTPFIDALHSELGWEAYNGEKITTVKQYTDYISKIIETNAVPNYSSPVVAQFDDFVAHGGDPATFLNNINKYGDLSNINLDDVVNQKSVMREYYRYKGMFSNKPEKIDRAIMRLEEDGELEAEAQDALAELTEIDTRERNELLEKQKVQATKIKENQILFIQETQKYINNITELNGIPLTSNDKKLALDYIFKQDKDGITQYQKDYNTNPVEVLSNTALFQVIKPKIETRVTNKVNKNVIDNLRKNINKFTSTGANISNSNKNISGDKNNNFAPLEEMVKYLT